MTEIPRGLTVGDVGEFGLIDWLTAGLTQAEHVYLGPGDDAALIRTPAGHVLVSADMLVQDRHFRLDWTDSKSIGVRAAAANLADIAAMGGQAHSLTLSLGLPATTEVQWVLDLADGFAQECDKVGASVVGGDLTSASSVVVAVSALGACTQAPLRRNGAQPGDVLALAGRQGWAAAGLAVLGRGFRSPRSVVQAFAAPEVPYELGPAAAKAGAHAMCDVSDSLVGDAGHIATASNVQIDIDTSCFEVPEPLQAVGAAIGMDPMDLILSGGDDHGLLATFAPGEIPSGFTRIGEVHPKPGDEGAPAVIVDGEPYEPVAEHRHFKE